MGLFTPIWMTTKEEKIPKAIAAVEKMSDPAKLKTIATSARSGRIRAAACTRITDRDTLSEIAMAGDCDVACALIGRLAGRDDLLMSVAAHFASGYNARLLVPLLDMIGEPDIEKLIEFTCTIVDQRKRDKKWFRDIDGYERIMEAVGRTACRVNGDRARATALVEDCAGGSNYALISAQSAAASFQTVVGWHTPIIHELEGSLSNNSESLRAYIDSLKQEVVTLADGHQADRNRVILVCCMLEDTLRPYAYDIYVVLQTWLRCDLTVVGDKPDSRREELDRFERVCANWKKSAQALIILAKEQPEIIYPVRGQLEQAINGAEAQVRDRRQVGFKTVYQKVAPDAPEDWTEAVKVPDYKYTTKKIPMNLHFPAE